MYRLICKGTIEERILQRAREKSKIQKIVISGGSFKPDTLKPTEVVSLLLDDEEIERKCEFVVPLFGTMMILLNIFHFHTRSSTASREEEFRSRARSRKETEAHGRLSCSKIIFTSGIEFF